MPGPRANEVEKRGLFQVAGGAPLPDHPCLSFRPHIVHPGNCPNHFELQGPVKRIMELMINKETIDKTKKCLSDFSCLNGTDDCLCTVESTIANLGLLVMPGKYHKCLYKMSFGNGFICLCPVRYEIFTRSLEETP
jgi:hypothetical protein